MPCASRRSCARRSPRKRRRRRAGDQRPVPLGEACDEERLDLGHAVECLPFHAPIVLALELNLQALRQAGARVDRKVGRKSGGHADFGVGRPCRWRARGFAWPLPTASARCSATGDGGCYEHQQEMGALEVVIGAPRAGTPSGRPSHRPDDPCARPAAPERKRRRSRSSTRCPERECLCRDRICAGRSTVPRLGSTMTRSASKPGAILPLLSWRPTSAAGPSHTHLGACQTSPIRFASSRQLRYRVCTPGLPAGACSSGRAFSASVCGAWSVATMRDHAPARRRRPVPSRSSGVRTGGNIFIAVPSRSKILLGQQRYCGQVSRLSRDPSLIAASAAMRPSALERCAMCRLRAERICDRRGRRDRHRLRLGRA